MSWKKSEKKKAAQWFSDVASCFGMANCLTSFSVKDKDHSGDDADIARCADVSFELPYRSISLSLYPEFWNQSWNEQKRILLHEAMHCAITPMKKNRLIHEDIFVYHEEEFCEHMSMGLIDIIDEKSLKCYSDTMPNNQNKPKKRKKKGKKN